MDEKTMIRTAVFAGSFNPFTVGHADIVARALGIFDRLVIVVGINAAKSGDEGRAVEAAIRDYYSDEPRVQVMSWSGLTVDAAREVGACALVRGVRSVKDFEYERDMADVNMRLAGLETALFASRPELGAVSSSLVRELQAMGADTAQFLPKKD